MRRALLCLLFSLSFDACLDFGTGSGTSVGGPRTCAQLGWACGTDGTGASCGTCDPSQTCSSGMCVDPGSQTVARNATAYVLAGGYFGTLFTLSAPATLHFSATSPQTFQVGVFTLSDWMVFDSGQAANSYILTNPTPSVTDLVRLPAGTFTLGFRCATDVEACTIQYNATASP